MAAPLADHRGHQPGSPILPIALLCFGHFLAMVDRLILSAVLPIVKADLRLTDAQLGLVQGTGFAFGYAIGFVACFTTGAAWRRATIVAGIAVWTAGELTCGLSTTIAGLMAGQVLAGTGQAMFIPAALATIFDLGTARHARPGGMLSLFTASSTTGRSVSVLLAGSVLAWLTAGRAAGAPLPWRNLYLIATGAGVVLCTALIVQYRHRREDATTGSRVRPVALGRWFRDAWRPCATIVGTTLPIILLIQAGATWLPSLVARRWGIAPAEAAILVGAVTLLTAPAGQLIGGRIGNRYPAVAARPLAAMLTGLGIGCAAAWTIAGAGSVGAMLAAIGCLNLALGVASFLGLLGLQMRVPAALRVRVTGMFLMLVTLAGFGAGPALVGILSDAGGAGGIALGHALAHVATAAALTAAIAGAIGKRSLNHSPSLAV